MSDTPDPSDPAPGDEYQWRDGEREVVVWVRDDGLVATAVVYPSIEEFAATMQLDAVESAGVNEDVASLPDADWFASLDLPIDDA
ncbi:hypothetical protein C2R22_06020 [Salinigranum rubrum]|uniref:Uncharacterized protein n=1 Tax=Salinigranum rubrum TaxID=755307 RepID=A0A2I8VH70_9EURY|nr:hypothetical protein [Salinigranum rubrum]AUV81275.1 hypothetical protein C2R22_06020 [Salinigranum rubrum]